MQHTYNTRRNVAATSKSSNTKRLVFCSKQQFFCIASACPPELYFFIMLYNEHAMAILYSHSPRRFWPVFSTPGCPEVSASAVSERRLA